MSDWIPLKQEFDRLLVEDDLSPPQAIAAIRARLEAGEYHAKSASIGPSWGSLRLNWEQRDWSEPLFLYEKPSPEYADYVKDGFLLPAFWHEARLNIEESSASGHGIDASRITINRIQILRSRPRRQISRPVPAPELLAFMVETQRGQIEAERKLLTESLLKKAANSHFGRRIPERRWRECFRVLDSKLKRARGGHERTLSRKSDA
jgi:hypothetical protein